MVRLFLALSFIWCGLLTGETPYSQKSDELKKCLESTWSLDAHSTAFIKSYFEGFLNDETQHHHLDEFIAQSNALNIQFPPNKKLPPLCPCDGTLLATKFHPVVFENPYIRIVAGVAEPGEREPFHNHRWKSILVLFEDAAYLVEYPNGSTETLSLSSGIYILPPEDLYACTNMGTKKENCLRFEVKD